MCPFIQTLALKRRGGQLYCPNLMELKLTDVPCDVTDIIDNVTGAAIGVFVGLVLLPVVRPWRARGRRRAGIG